MRRQMMPRLLVLAVYLVFAVGYAVVLPVDAGPDEAAHVEYVRVLQEQRALPQIPGFGGQERLQTIAAQHPPLYYVVMAVISAPFGAGSAAGLLVMRLASVLMGAAALWLVFAAARRLWPDSWIPLAAGFFALLPCYQYMTGVVNNSTGVILSAAVVVWAMSRAVDPDEGLRAWLGAGLGFAAAVACKLTGAWLGALIAVAFIICARRDGWDLKRLVATAGASLGPAIIPAGLWLCRSMMVYGMLMPQSITHRPLLPDAGLVLLPELSIFFATILTPEILAGLATPFWLLKLQGWNTWAVGLPVAGFLLLGVAGYVRARGEPRDTPGLKRSVIAAGSVVGFGAAVGLVFWLMMRDYGALNFGGRYLQASMPALGMAWAIGFCRLVKTERARRWTLAAIFALLIAFSIYTRAWIIGFQVG